MPSIELNEEDKTWLLMGRIYPLLFEAVQEADANGVASIIDLCQSQTVGDNIVCIICKQSQAVLIKGDE